MSTVKKGIVVFAVLILAVSSAFAIETIQLKSLKPSSKGVKDAVYEGILVKGGPAVSIITMRDTLSDRYIKATGFGFEAGVKYDKYYVEFNMAFPKDVTIGAVKLSKIIQESLAPGEKAELNVSFFSVSAGYAKKIIFGNFNLTLGGGVMFKHLSFKASMVEPGYEFIKVKLSSIGLNALIDGRYMFTENIGLGLTLNPQIGIYNTLVDDHEKYNGEKIGIVLTLPVVLGVSFSF